jgi:hypothetical protein
MPTSEPNTTAPPRPRRRRLRRLAGVTVVVAGLFTAGYWLGHWQAERDWRAACAEADRLDPGWRWDDLLAARPNLPDEHNAALRVREVKRLLPNDWLTRVWAIVDQSRGNPTRNQRPSPALVADLRTAYDAIPEALARVAGLEDLPSGRLVREHQRPVLLHLPVDDVQDMRVVANLLQFYARLLAEEGRADDALTAVRQLLATARAAGAEPLLISTLVCQALRAIALESLERVLALSEPTSDALALTQRALEAEAEWPLLPDAVRGERALIEDFARAMEEGKLTSAQADQFDGAPLKVTGIGVIDHVIHRFRGGGWSKRKAAEMVRFYTVVIEILKKSPDALGVSDLDAAWASAGVSATTRKAYAPMYHKVLEADRRSRATLRSAAAAVAAERFRRDTGHWPAALDELVPAYVTAVPLDPYDGRPLRSRRLDDGFVVYSVGPDQADDGGQVHSGGPRGLPKDYGLRLWDPAQRRQPPEPGQR